MYLLIVGTKPELRSESEEAKCVAEAKMRRLTKMPFSGEALDFLL